MLDINRRIAAAFARIRDERPLIHHITNLVVMNDTANLTLHVGALPVMTDAIEEVADMTRQASALLLNLGTPAPNRIESMLAAGRVANEQGIPIVLDPVGAGATRVRTEMSLRLLDELRIAVLRGNPGEIGAIDGSGGVVKGVESVRSGGAPATIARHLAGQRGIVIAISGARDTLSDGTRVWGVDNGHPWLTALTGTGCMSTTMIAAFAAVEPDPLVAAAAGLACFGLAAELAAANAAGPASFKVALFDRLYNLTPEELADGARIVELAPSLTEVPDPASR